MARNDGRKADQLRPVKMTLGAQDYPEGSVLVETGDTRVLCAVTVETGVPSFLRGLGKGWVTAEYAMLPRSTLTRTPRSSINKGRTKEIQRLIGRSLRAIMDMETLGERTLTVDCDVLQADGGTRTASITGAYVALELAIRGLVARGDIGSSPLRQPIAATSVGLLAGEALLDLNYEEDFRADVDFNVVMTEDGRFVEVQGSGEEAVFDRAALDRVLDLAGAGIAELIKAQAAALKA
jgi:ribonuclease PH